jgi:imidazolonepropionase-like amidohydrolase
VTELGAWRLPPILLPDGEERPLWINDGLFTTTSVPRAPALPGRFALPGLVDAHAHITLVDHQPADAAAGAGNLLRLRDQGVLLVRDVGSPQSATLDLEPHPELPTLLAAGRWHAPEGRFYGPYHRPVPAEALTPSALTEMARGATWVKVIADWTTPELSYPVEALRAMIERVHAAGGRVAAHTQWQGVREIVDAGVDSVEHGCRLDPDTLEVMARRGVAWTPTLSAFNAPLAPDARPDLMERRDEVLANYREMLPIADRVGVTILAGTDTVGTVVDEIRQLIDYGLTPVAALRTGTTAARAFLGRPALEGGAPADVITFEADPREDPEVLRWPVAVVLGGRRFA